MIWIKLPLVLAEDSLMNSQSLIGKIDFDLIDVKENIDFRPSIFCRDRIPIKINPHGGITAHLAILCLDI